MGLLIHCLFWQKSRQNALFFCFAEKYFEGFGRDGCLKSGFRSHLSRFRDNLSRKNRDKPISYNLPRSRTRTRIALVELTGGRREASADRTYRTNTTNRTARYCTQRSHRRPSNPAAPDIGKAFSATIPPRPRRTAVALARPRPSKGG